MLTTVNSSVLFYVLSCAGGDRVVCPLLCEAVAIVELSMSRNYSPSRLVEWWMAAWGPVLDSSQVSLYFDLTGRVLIKIVTTFLSEVLYGPHVKAVIMIAWHTTHTMGGVVLYLLLWVSLTICLHKPMLLLLFSWPIGEPVMPKMIPTKVVQGGTLCLHISSLPRTFGWPICHTLLLLQRRTLR